LKISSALDAEKSWNIAQRIYLSLPPGEGSEEIESALVNARVKLDKLTLPTNENSFRRQCQTRSSN
jgi:hypothetical protein